MKNAAIITGAAKRIGKATAIALAGEGFDIALHYLHSENDAISVKEEIESLGRTCRLIQADLNDISRLESIISESYDAFPYASVLVNNASIFEKANFLETNPELLSRHFNINFNAPFWLTQSFVKKFQQGHIINILDTKITDHMPGYFAYSLTKKSLYHFTQMAARELGPEFKVNGVCPGMILPSKDTSGALLKKMSRRLPLKRQGEVKDVVQTVLFLIHSTYITGETIMVNGGEHLT